MERNKEINKPQNSQLFFHTQKTHTHIGYIPNEFFYTLQIVANRFLICDILPDFFKKRNEHIICD